MVTLEEKANSLVDRAVENNEWRQRQTFNLIPSENTPSLVVKLLEISDPAGRYAEHRATGRTETYYYQGIDFIRSVENELIAEFKTYMGARQVELRVTSGNMANLVTFQAYVSFLKRQIKTVINNELNKGGHLSAQHMGALFGNVQLDRNFENPHIVNSPVLTENPYKTDTSQLVDLIQDNKPDLIILGKSMYLFPEPESEVLNVVNGMRPRPLVMHDKAHILGLHAGMLSDVVTGSTHKTYFGTQRGQIAVSQALLDNYRGLWTQIRSRAFPGNTSNHHLGTLLGLLMASYEMNEFKETYQTQVKNNAKAFARALKSYGIQVEGEAHDYTETHQVVINVREYGNGKEIAQRLEDNNLITNFQALPYDESFNDPSGIRMGVQEMTRFGMKEKDFETLAANIADVIINGKNVKDEVSLYRNNFMQMQYTIAPAIALPLAAKLLTSIMPNSDYAKQFTENMTTLVK